MLGSAARIARAQARESAPAYTALGVLAAGAAVAAGLRAGGELSEAARARLALEMLAGLLEPLAVAAAALAVALTLPRDLASGRAATILVRPIGRAGFLAGRLGGACLAALATAAAALSAFGALALAAWGPGPLAALAPPAEIAPAEVLVPVGGGEPGPAPPRFSLPSGHEALWRFEGLRPGAARRLRIAPAYALAGGLPAPVEVRIDIEGAAPEGPLGPARAGIFALPARRAAEIDLPPAFARATRLAVLVSVESPDALVGFSPRGAEAGEPRGLTLSESGSGLAAAAGAALAGLFFEATVAAALALFGATFLTGWPAALFALGLALAARSRDLLWSFGEHFAPGALGPIARGVAAILPDLGRTDFLGTIAAGRSAGPADLARGLGAIFPHAALALLFAALVFGLREPGAKAAS
jgi:hypothetical protein